MRAPKCSEEEFIRLFMSLGAAGLSREIGTDIRNIYTRRANIEKKLGIVISTPTSPRGERIYTSQYEARVPLKILSGQIFIGSDFHYWPELISTAHRGFLYLAKELKPKIIIANGDVFDGAQASRHPPIGWAKSPTIKEELDSCEERLDEIRKAGKGAEFFWTIGNHDMRFETRLAATAKEFEGVPGFSLGEHFPHWKLAMSFWVNNEVVIKHRYKGGIHATHNNVVGSGMSIVTGHLHSLKVCPYDDYRPETRFGVDTGTMAGPYGPQFEYQEDNPRNHRSGFVILTFHKSKLLWPEVVNVVDENTICFRGELISV